MGPRAGCIFKKSFNYRILEAHTLYVCKQDLAELKLLEKLGPKEKSGFFFVSPKHPFAQTIGFANTP